MNKLPLARHTDIIVQELGKELLIYDLTTNRAYSLNETSAAVYRACDGANTFSDLRAEHKFTDELIFLALDELKRESLIRETDYPASPLAGVTRREAIRRVGLGTMVALPLISSLIAPTAAMAQSGGAPEAETTPPGGFYLSGNCTTNDACTTTCATTGPTQCAAGTPANNAGCGSFCLCQCPGDL